MILIVLYIYLAGVLCSVLLENIIHYFYFENDITVGGILDPWFLWSWIIFIVICVMFIIEYFDWKKTWETVILKYKIKDKK